MTETTVAHPGSPLMSVSELRNLIDTGAEGEQEKSPHGDQTIIFDCRFQLGQPDWGQQAFLDSHIPGARFLDLDKDLSSAVIPGETGRHPLPQPEALATTLATKGVNTTTRIIVYDDGPGFYAARAWWLLRWLGHESVYVLNGGMAAWVADGGETESGTEQEHQPGNFQPTLHAGMTVNATEVMASLAAHDLVLIDARAEARFRGEVEPIDPVAGHIPGAVCLPCNENVDEQGYFRDSEVLARRLGRVGSDSNRVCYCGSGVTACHNILAAAVAGLPLPRLYAGSWSEWITRPDRPIATTD